MGVMGVWFGIQQVVFIHLGKTYDAYLALSGYGMKSGHVWELFTYQFLHSAYSLPVGLLHLLINFVGLWFLGRAVEARLGGKRFLLLYLGAVLAGGLLQGGFALSGYVVPESYETAAAFLRDRFGGPFAGASVGLCGVLAVFCRLNQAVILLRVALALAVIFSLVPVFIPSDPGLAHLAHLGGLLAGLAFFKLAKGRGMGTGAEAR
jgi:membrane associated rhomboid family serine protease